VAIIKKFTVPASLSAIMICFGPVQTAIGIISPNHSTQVTEIIIAQNSGNSLSKYIGRASIQVALQSSNVTNK